MPTGITIIPETFYIASPNLYLRENFISSKIFMKLLTESKEKVRNFKTIYSI